LEPGRCFKSSTICVLPVGMLCAAELAWSFLLHRAILGDQKDEARSSRDPRSPNLEHVGS